jgi:hypothetical protein
LRFTASLGALVATSGGRSDGVERVEIGAVFEFKNGIPVMMVSGQMGCIVGPIVEVREKSPNY